MLRAHVAAATHIPLSYSIGELYRTRILGGQGPLYWNIEGVNHPLCPPSAATDANYMYMYIQLTVISPLAGIGLWDLADYH